MHNKLLKKLSFFGFNSTRVGFPIFVLIIFLLNFSAYAQSLKKNKENIKNSVLIIKSIEVVGQKKIEKEAIIARLVSKIGEAYSEKNISEDIKAIFKMGFFVEIDVFKEDTIGGLALEYRVLEKPTVSEIVFEGNEDIKTEDLETQISIKAYEILNQTKIKESVAKLEKHYEEKGFYLAKINAEVEDVVTGDSVKIKFKLLRVIKEVSKFGL